MKKVIALLLVVLMLVSLCACGGEADTDAGANNAGEATETTGAPKETTGETDDSNAAEPAYTGLQVGYSKMCITPDYEVGLGGYSDAETRTAQNRVEDVYITCIAVKSGEETILVYTIDNCSFDHNQAEMLRAQIKNTIGIKGEKVFVGATHTHNAPAFSAYDNASRYLADVVNIGGQAAQAALADLTPATLSRARAVHEGMNFVRHYILADGTLVPNSGANGREDEIVGHPMETDEEMTILKFDREGDKKDVLMVNWQTHPDSASSIGYYSISPGFVGPMRNRLESLTGMHVAYFTGAAGNQNPVSKWKEENHGMKWHEYGEALADCAYAMMDQFEPVQGETIKTSRYTIDAPVDHSWDHMLAQANEVYEVWKRDGKEAGDALGATYGFTSSYQARAIRSRARMSLTTPMEINTFCIGDIGFTTGTYEMFSTNALFVKENSPYETTFVICGTSTYMPADIAYTYRGYEQDTTLYARGTGEMFADQYVKMLTEMKNS